GAYNKASAQGATVGGGQDNEAAANYNTTVAGGSMNKAYADRATVGGGESNEAMGEGSVIAGGSGNRTWGFKASVPGGYQNSATGNYSFAAGYRSTAAAHGTFSWADSQGTPLVNNVADQVRFKARGGFFVSGSTNTIDPGLLVTGAGDVFIGSGVYINRFGAIQSTGPGNGSIVGAPRHETAIDLQTHREVSDQVASAYLSVISGGGSNKASGNRSTVAGGYNNLATSESAVISGGYLNRAGGMYSVVPGGVSNSAAGDYSFAAGRKASSNSPGAFTWADSEDFPVTNSVSDQVMFKARGGFWVSTGTVYNDPGFFVNAGNQVTALRLGASLFSKAGALQYSGGNFQGHNGVSWINFGTNGGWSDAGGVAYLTNLSARAAIGTMNPATALHVKAGFSGDGVTIDNQSDVNGEYVGAYFKIAAVDDGTRRKAGIFLERTDTYGRGNLRFALDNTGDNSDVDLADTKVMITTGAHVVISGATADFNPSETAGGINESKSLVLHAAAVGGAAGSAVNIVAAGADSGCWSSNMNFWTRPGGCAGVDPVKRMTISKDGDVGISTDTPRSRLHINGDVGLGDGMAAGNKPIVVWLLNNSGTTLNPGTIVIVDPGLANAVNITGGAENPSAVGVVYETSINPGAVGKVAISGVAPV
ncbi:MAG: hypothetical protein RQ748_12010, partial [Elusimicrobiales bacterium]|nr:hypothetical protein [Elusimicrobiales bacterium]